MALYRKKKPQVSHRPRAYGGGEVQKSNVFSYHSNRSQNPVPEARQYATAKPSVRRRRVQWRYVPTFIAACAIIISVGYLLTVNTNPRVIFISENGTGPLLLRDSKVYQQAADKILSGSILNYTKITINTGAFAKDMKQQFPELSDVAVTLPLMGRRPIVEVAAANPALILASQKGTYLVASDGRAIMPASEARGLDGLKLPKVGDQNSADIKLGHGALPADEVAYISEVVGQLQAKNLAVDTLTLPALADELDVRIQGLPYFVKFNIQTDPRQATGTFLATKQNLESRHITPAEYIDVRVEEKVYYK